VVTLALVAPAAAQFGQVVLVVKTPDGEPAEASASVECDKGFRDEREANRRGRITFTFADALQNCRFRVEAEGYAPIQLQLRPPLGEPLIEELTLRPLLSGATDEGEQVLPSGSVASYTPAQTAFNEGADALRTGDAEAAVAKFKEALEKDPSLVEVYGALAAAYANGGDWEQVVVSGQQAIASAGESAQVQRLLYEAYRELGRHDEAEAARQAMARLGEGRDAAVFAYNEGVGALRVGDDQSAKLLFEEALAAKPDMPQALQGLAAIQLRAGDFGGAAANLERLLVLEPKNETALRMRWEAYQRLGDAEKTDQAFAALVAANPKALAAELFEQGKTLFEGGQAEAAQGHFQRVLEIDPSVARAFYYLGLCYVSAGKPELARENLQKFIAMAPDDPEVANAKEMLGYLE
jgi:tetratricopeptide (TPR) repeat protein